MSGSGLGKSVTTREMTLLSNENLEEVKFNQSSIGTATKKALESATAKVVKRMIQKQVFTN
jgi:ABC-type transporter Mla maintaining outer membrane lipid asymmetry ATPase subunit MlaF